MISGALVRSLAHDHAHDPNESQRHSNRLRDARTTTPRDQKSAFRNSSSERTETHVKRLEEKKDTELGTDRIESDELDRSHGANRVEVAADRSRA
jgi:hypothetical protein